MASVQVLSVVAPPVPPSYKLPSVPSTSRISGIVFVSIHVTKDLPPCYHFLATHPSGHRTLLPVGPAYLTHLRVSLHHAHSFSSLDKHLAAERERLAALHGDDVAGEDDLGDGDEEESQELLKSDPKEWKVLSILPCMPCAQPNSPILRNKINMLSLVSLTSVIKLLRSR